MDDRELMVALGAAYPSLADKPSTLWYWVREMRATGEDGAVIADVIAATARTVEYPSLAAFMNRLARIERDRELAADRAAESGSVPTVPVDDGWTEEMAEESRRAGLAAIDGYLRKFGGRRD